MENLSCACSLNAIVNVAQRISVLFVPKAYAHSVYQGMWETDEYLDGMDCLYLKSTMDRMIGRVDSL